MRILAIETTESPGSVAALDGPNLLAERELDPSRRTTQGLAPALKALLEQVNWTPADVQLVAVTQGPGSFTGLRVGLAAAKTFAYATGADILGIDTLEAVAGAAPDDLDALWVAVDAQRGQVVAGRFVRRPDGWLRPAAPAELVDTESWLASLPPGTALSGPALKRWAHRVPPHLKPLARHLWCPTASAVGRLAARDYAEGRRDDPWTIAPRYSRPSAAEEKWRARAEKHT